MEEQLASILPPREIMKNDELHIQKVSPEPASRKTIIQKSELLDKKLQAAQVSVKYELAHFNTGCLGARVQNDPKN